MHPDGFAIGGLDYLFVCGADDKIDAAGVGAKDAGIFDEALHVAVATTAAEVGAAYRRHKAEGLAVNVAAVAGCAVGVRRVVHALRRDLSTHACRVKREEAAPLFVKVEVALLNGEHVLGSEAPAELDGDRVNGEVEVRPRYFQLELRYLAFLYD